MLDLTDKLAMNEGVGEMTKMMKVVQLTIALGEDMPDDKVASFLTWGDETEELQCWEQLCGARPEYP